MGIYRGPGGTGDAVNDASSEALITIQARDAALAAQAAAELARDAAQLAETNAETAETNAETAETNAETAATNAANSASAASTSASNAASSASAASTSASNASTSASNAASSASAASTSASNAASSASTATTQATNASNSASAAATSATNASNSASAAATSATNAANSATAAQTAQTAAELAETNAETAEANAEAAQAAAETAETNAETAATNAANSASAAATSATNASNSASAAATSATNASNSASAAATSATNASNSASAAATSATNAAASYDSFDDRYLGAKSSAPTLDNDGNTLLVGALYFNTNTNEMKVWDGSTWLNAYASLSGALLATNNLSDLNNAATARDNLGVEIGVDVQAYDAQLADIAGLTPADNNFIVGNGTNFVTESGSTARTSLGLGSIATQDANNVAFTGGSINGTTVGASTPSTGSFTSLTDSGNLTFTGTGNRITGDFSNATLANRTLFQNSVANSTSVVGVIPSGTGVISRLAVFNNSDPTNASQGDISVTSAEVAVRSLLTGTGTFLPLTMYTGGSERLRIDTSGNVGIGTSSPARPLDVNGSLRLSDSSVVEWGGTSANIAGSSSSNALFFRTASTERMRIDSSGNVGIGTSSPNTKLEVNQAITFSNIDTFGQLVVKAASGANGKLLNIGVDDTNNLSFIQSVNRGTDSNTLVLQRYGGNTQVNGNLLFNSGFGSAATAYGCRAWVNFNGTGTPSIRASGNVSSITDAGTGKFRVNFTTAMSDANYATQAISTNNLGVSMGFTSLDSNDQSTSQTNLIWVGYPNGTLYDPVVCNVAVFR